MGRKSKNIISGATSMGGAGMATGNPYAAVGGAVLGGIMGSQQDDEVRQLPPVVAQDVVDKMYAQANGAPTIGELKGAQMFDKTLAQQIAAAKTQRGVNPALLQRNVSRIAAEQSQANAQSAAILSADERNKAMTQYMYARQLNAGVEAKNMGFEQAADSQANSMMGAGISSLGANLALQTQRDDAAAQMDSAKMDKDVQNSSVVSQDLAKAFTMGADQNAYRPQINPANVPAPGSVIRGVSDKNLKTKVKSEDMVMMSDERQKDLIKTESLPANNNLAMQNQGAVAQAAQPAMQQMPQTQQQQVAQPAQATPAASVPTSQFGVTSEMLQQAQKSSKGGGNISDIKNKEMTLQRGAAGPSADEILQMSTDAQRRQSRDIFGNVTQSDAENYQANLGRWFAARDAQNVAYDKEAGTVQEANAINDAQRTNRLNRFYTGIDSGSSALAASQYAPKVVTPNSDWNSAQAAQNAAGVGNQSQSGGWQNIQGHLNQFVNSPYASVAGSLIGGPGLGGAIASGQLVSKNPELAANPIQYGLNRKSDENLKTDKKAEGSADFNPKSFLDKLQAYSYEYKQGAKNMEGAGEGRHLSVMAQDLEKAGPVGQSMVQEDEQGNKSVDYGKGFGAILASQAQLNERLSQIEKMYPKKKKEA